MRCLPSGRLPAASWTCARQADPRDRARGLGLRSRFLGAVEPQRRARARRRCRAGRRPARRCRAPSSAASASRAGTCGRCRGARSRTGLQPTIDSPAEDDAPAGERERAGDEIEHRALAGAVRSDEAEDLAGLDRERQVVDGDQPAELLARGADLEQRPGWRGLRARGQRLRVGDRRRRAPRQQVRDPRPDARRARAAAARPSARRTRRSRNCRSCRAASAGCPAAPASPA